MTSTWTHLPCRQCSKVAVRPALLNGLTVSPTNSLRIVERVIYLTRRAMARKVEFWNVVRNLEPPNIEIGVVFCGPLEVVYGPLASNVV